MVRRVAREHVGEARLHADAAQREPARGLPLAGHRELRVAQLHAGLLERALGMALGQRHRHVQVRAAGPLGGREDRRVQPRVAGVEDHVGALGLGQRDDRVRVGRVEPAPREAVVARARRRRPAPGRATGRRAPCGSKKPRRRAMAATALPTPPAPMTTIRMARHCRAPESGRPGVDAPPASRTPSLQRRSRATTQPTTAKVAARTVVRVGYRHPPDGHRLRARRQRRPVRPARPGCSPPRRRSWASRCCCAWSTGPGTSTTTPATRCCGRATSCAATRRSTRPTSRRRRTRSRRPCRVLATPFGDGGDALMLWLILLCFGLLVWLTYRLGAELFSPWAGVVAALVVLTRPALERDALLGYQDTAFACVIVGAVLLEARRRAPRRGRARAARARRADAAGGVGARRPLLPLDVAGERPPAPAAARGDGRRGAAALGAVGPARHRRRAALPARHGRPRRGRRPPPRRRSTRPTGPRSTTATRCASRS